MEQGTEGQAHDLSTTVSQKHLVSGLSLTTTHAYFIITIKQKEMCSLIQKEDHLWEEKENFYWAP